MQLKNSFLSINFSHKRSRHTPFGFYLELKAGDTGSTDDTKNIAISYTDQVYEFPWSDDFAAAPNYAYARCDYIMWLDADNVMTQQTVTASLRSNIHRLLKWYI